MTPSQLVIKLQIAGARELEKIVKDLGKAFGTSKTGTAGKGTGLDAQVKTAKDLGKVIGKDVVDSVDKLHKKLREITNELNTIKRSSGGLVDQFGRPIEGGRGGGGLAPPVVPGSPPGGGGGGGRGGLGAFINGAYDRIAPYAGYLGAATWGMTAARFGITEGLMYGGKGALYYGPETQVKAAELGAMGLAASKGDVGSALAQLVIDRGGRQLDKARDIAEREQRWASTKEVLGSLTGNVSYGIAAIGDAEARAQIAREQAEQAYAQVQVGGMNKQERERADVWASQALRNVRLGMALGDKNTGLAREIVTGGAGSLVGDSERASILTMLLGSGGRSYGTKALVDAVAEGVEKGYDAAMTVRAHAAGGAAGANIVANMTRAGADPVTVRALVDAMASSTGLGTFRSSTGSSVTGLAGALSFGLDVTDDAARQARMIQENMRGLQNLGSHIAGKGDAWNRSVNYAVASKITSDPFLLDLVANFGDDPRQLAELMKGKGDEGVPSYLSFVKGDVLRQNVRDRISAMLTASPISQEALSKAPLLQELIANGGDMQAAFQKLNAGSPEQQQRLLAQASGVFAVQQRGSGDAASAELFRNTLYGMAGLQIDGAGGIGGGGVGRQKDVAGLPIEDTQSRYVAALNDTAKAHQKYNEKMGELIEKLASKFEELARKADPYHFSVTDGVSNP